MRPEAVLERRRAERERLLGQARAFVRELRSRIDVRAAVVFGSVARGDFNAHSDIDLLVVVDAAPPDFWARAQALGDVPAGVEAVVWTPAEWRRQHGRGNPIAVEAARDGVWLAGSPDTAASAARAQ